MSAARQAILREIEALSKITVRDDAHASQIVRTYVRVVDDCRRYLEAEEERDGRQAVRAIASGEAKVRL